MDFDQLKALSSVKYQQSQHALAKITAREAELRAELDRMRSLVVETQSQPPEHAQMRAIGADVIWLSWVGQVQKQLNITLAQVLAQKERHMASHKEIHGKKLVSDQLAADHATKRQKELQEKRLRTAIDGTLMR